MFIKKYRRLVLEGEMQDIANEINKTFKKLYDARNMAVAAECWGDHDGFQKWTDKISELSDEVLKLNEKLSEKKAAYAAI